ncbi:hypothetical protein HAX39_25090 [Citrobacter freundii]|nr:hypothetical protein [Citrobacter freundii]
MRDTTISYIGQRRSGVSGHYLLGNGYRGFNPVLKRFAGQDSLSPFGAGGEHGFAYCEGNPVNRTDPSGHLIWELLFIADQIVKVAVDAEAEAEAIKQALAAGFDEEKRRARERPGRNNFINNVITNENAAENRTSGTMISEIRACKETNKIASKSFHGRPQKSRRNIARLQYRTAPGDDLYTRLSISGKYSSGRPDEIFGEKLIRPEDVNMTFEGLDYDYDRNYDTEALLINDLTMHLKNKNLNTGEVYLHSELTFCSSCQYVIQQFKEAYPNIHLFVGYR